MTYVGLSQALVAAAIAISFSSWNAAAKDKADEKPVKPSTETSKSSKASTKAETARSGDEHGGVKLDAGLPEYKPAKGISGRLKSVGSDTMANVVLQWNQGFKKLYPGVQPEAEGKGSGTAMPALIAGAAEFGMMSREVNAGEIDKFEKKYGYKPMQVPAAIDMLAVFVHKDNPIAGLSLQQLDAIFSQTRARGGKSDIRTWGEVGLKGEWADKPISLYSRNPASGTYTYFMEHVLAKGSFKSTVKEQPGSSAVVQGVANDRYAIGYSGIGYKTADVRAVPLSDKGGKMVGAEPDNAYNGSYPLSRYLLLVVNHKPGAPLEPAVKREFLKYVLSRTGQQDVAKEGFLPITAKIAERSLKSVDLDASGK